MTSGRFDSAYHAPVLVDEVLAALAGAHRVLDCTLGGGGHSLALLEAGKHVVGIDRDPQAIAAATERLSRFAADGRFRAVPGTYADLVTADGALGHEPFDGALLDLGISSHQIDDEARGFSFREGAPLDMRMGGDAAELATAADVLNASDERELIRVFKTYGDEPKASRLAHEVARRRANRPFATSDDFVGAIRAVLGPRSGPGDFARLFQALRIVVNDELEGLARALPALRDRLAPGGVLAVIAYHSGEDRIVKHAFREWSLSCVCPPKQLQCTCRGRPLGTPLTKKAVTANADEIARNPRARSAHLRAWRKAAAEG
ncbi:MAG: 16S rRNA (cytosine(1402)-N(4))-methyltransferase RsmH [Gemmatimonadetes bacterium]|nr:16S rRNA (cytosine(1402)-N(4))-methyltransferase RsmH [Gemmatimonadota bacterium]MBI3567305.1 16S rRNA (cytosine(1402)-N(4))-methyltransferase RsmH [Gemmatimonadota bacterium]